VAGRPVTALDQLRGLVLARKVLDREIGTATVEALRCGAPRGSVAYALGISRASLYRQFGSVMVGAS
jgi:uncharacterized protein (DUF2062 family)